MSSITESQNGEIIIRLHHKDTKSSELEEALRNELGTFAAVRMLVKTEDVEILDLNCATTATELETCIRKALGSDEDDQSIRVKSIRQSFRGTQRATAKLKSADAAVLTNKGHIKVGWVSARVRAKTRIIKCYR